MHEQEPTDASIESVDGLASFSQRRREEEERREGAIARLAQPDGAGYERREEDGYDHPHSPAPAHYSSYPPSSTPSAPRPFSSLTSQLPPSFPPAPPTIPYSSPTSYDPSSPPFRPPLRDDPPSFSSLPYPSTSYASGSGSTPSYEHGLPAFSSWHGSQPYGGGANWRESGYFPPFPPSSQAQRGWVRDPFEEAGEEYGRGGDLGYRSLPYGRAAEVDEDDYEDEEEKPEGGGEFHHPAGSYQHGVGFDGSHLSPSSPSSGGRQKSGRAMRRLEREFGPSPSSPSSAQDDPLAGLSGKARYRAFRRQQAVRQAEEASRSGVDEKGRLIGVGGRRRRVLLRWAQGVGAVVVGVGSIGAAVLTHPSSDPPPKGHPPLYLLYLLPFLSLFLTLFLHVVRPAMYRRRTRAGGMAGQGGGGMVVPLVQGAPGGGGGGRNGGGWTCCGSRRRSRVPRGAPGQGQTTVNLVVDPAVLAGLTGGGAGGAAEEEARRKRERERREKKDRRRRRRRRKERPARRRGGGEEGEEGEESDSSLVSSSSSSCSSSLSSAPDAAAARDRLSTLLPQRLAASRTFHLARRWLLKVVWAEAAAGVVWAAESVWAIGWGGGKCPVGGFEGYCNLYNLALAFAVLTAVVFFASAALSAMDLVRSKKDDPRLRQERAIAGEGGGAV
ncbi:hypothetical protein JCM8097_001578 [Rhodosporidiobolus ruineniae]